MSVLHCEMCSCDSAMGSRDERCCCEAEGEWPLLVSCVYPFAYRLQLFVCGLVSRAAKVD